MKDAQNDECPADARTAAPYGGVRLEVYPGDHLRMKLINRLPPVPKDSENAYGTEGDAMLHNMLPNNPVNIHTHGLVVEPRKADAFDPTYGDYVYVLGYPAGKLPAMVHADETITDKPIQYDIYIPDNHPAGLFWFHPHVHGLTVNHLSEGLSGIISVGSPSDYLEPAAKALKLSQRFLMLKDMEVLSDGQAKDQEDARFCTPSPNAGETRPGFCSGRDYSSHDPRLNLGGDYTKGRWFFTINGQVYPSFTLDRSGGELWRIVNAGASRTYNLVLQDDLTHELVPFQVVSLNGSSLALPAGTTSDVIGGSQIQPGTIPCPVALRSKTPPVCATHLLLPPSARAEIWIASPVARTATLLTLNVNSGPAGDQWPAADLARVTIPALTTVGTLPLRSVPAIPPVSTVDPGTASFAGLGPAVQLRDADQIARGTMAALPGHSDPVTPALRQEVKDHLAALSQPVPSMSSRTCSALPQGHRRRIFLGIPGWNLNQYGLGYEEVDEQDKPVPNTFRFIAPFNPNSVNICLPLAPGNMPVTEEWELVNVSGEMHNFHIHQTRFYVLPENAPVGDEGKLMDNVLLPNGGGNCDGTVALWRLGRCKVDIVRVAIPFTQVGDFIYHCHIGEHQDIGMMAKIRVIAAH